MPEGILRPQHPVENLGFVSCGKVSFQRFPPFFTQQWVHLSLHRRYLRIFTISNNLVVYIHIYVQI